MDAYICHTVYHVLITLLKLSLDDTGVLILNSEIPNIEYCEKRIKKYFSKLDVFILDDSIFERRGLFYTNKQIKKFEELFENVHRFFIYNSHTSLGFFFHRRKIPYHIIEDGYNALQHPNSISPKTLKNRVKFSLYNIPRYHGFSKYCLSIEVNDLEGLPNDERLSKYIEKPKKEIFKGLDTVRRKALLDIFNVQKLYITNSSVLIITQPLAVDKLLDSEEKQLIFYSRIVEKYKNAGFSIYIKPHPRDKIDYTTLDVTVLPSSVPIELLDIIVNRPFEIGITAFSTSLDFLNCIQEKIFIDYKNEK